MNRSTRFAFSFVALLFSGAALAQSQDVQTDSITPEGKPAAPVAFVYVQSAKHPSGGEINAFTAAANGELKTIAGSPFNYNDSPQGANGKYLFGMESNLSTIDSFRIESNGAIEKVESLNTAQYDAGNCGNPGFFSLDRSGSKLYNVAFAPDCTIVSPEAVQSFSINSSDGKLDFLSDVGANPGGGINISVTGNNKYAYMPTSQIETGNSFGFAAYKRESNGSMEYLGDQWLMPAGNIGPAPEEPQAEFYWPEISAADSTDHVAAVLHLYDQELDDFGDYVGVYTAGSNGELSTTNTYQDMPGVAENPSWMGISPSNKYLAVAGSGLEVFHFNGANPVTKLKSLLSNVKILQAGWDNNGHLYALSSSHLYVYTVTSTSVTEASGSPYSIPSAESMMVQIK